MPILPLYNQSLEAAGAPGVYAIEVQTPVIVEGIPLGRIMYAGQFAWGPANEIYEPLDTSDYLRTYEPPGSPRNSPGYYGLMRRRRLSLAVVRVLGSGAVAATTTQMGTGGSWTATAKYLGALGNSISIVQAPASNGVAGNKKFTAILSDPITGTTEELIADNVAPPNGTAVTFDVSGLVLLTSFTVATALTAFPADGTFALTTGANGAAIGSSDYATALDALIQGATDGAVLLTDDPGNTIRSAVNDEVYDRTVLAAGRFLGIVQGATGAAFSAHQSDVANYRSRWVKYSGGWVYVRDDGGTPQRTPWSTYIASALINLLPQQSDAWRAAQVGETYYSTVDEIDTSGYNPGLVQALSTQLGISLPLRLPSGRHVGIHDRNTSLDVRYRYTVTSRISRFIALSLEEGLADWVNAPNVADEQNDLVTATRNFMSQQVSGGRTISFSISTSGNTPTTAALGQFFVDISAQTPAPMEQIGLRIAAGPTVEIIQ